MFQNKLAISYETENTADFILFDISMCKRVQSIQQDLGIVRKNYYRRSIDVEYIYVH